LLPGSQDDNDDDDDSFFPSAKKPEQPSNRFLLRLESTPLTSLLLQSASPAWYQDIYLRIAAAAAAGPFSFSLRTMDEEEKRGL
jgi:hypothetical protein